MADAANKNRGCPVNFEVQIATNNVAWVKRIPWKYGVVFYPAALPHVTNPVSVGEWEWRWGWGKPCTRRMCFLSLRQLLARPVPSEQSRQSSVLQTSMHVSRTTVQKAGQRTAQTFKSQDIESETRVMSFP